MAKRRPPTKKPQKKTRPSISASKTSKTLGSRPGELSITPAIGKPVFITDVGLRDGHQSLLATRMRTEDMLPIAQKLDAVGYWSLEVWGGATFDTCLRFLKEDPWERLRALRAAMPNTKLQMLLRGQNLVGYRHYADDVVERFIERSATNGIDVFRIFDALNDVRNLDRAVSEVKACGKHAEATICYTVSPVHSIDRFVDLAKKLEDLGTDTICIKDMAGLLAPLDAYHLVRRLKAAVKVPLHLHSHYTSGMASMASLMAILGGLDMLDTSISPLAGGTSHPATETLVASLQNTPYDTRLDLTNFQPITEHFRTVRRKYRQFESDFTGVDAEILTSQIPGGMLSNLAAQLTEQNALDRMKEVLDEVPRVRKEMGYPPLVTPTSQIVGTQATLNVLTGERYKVITTETKNYFLGLYGRAPGQVDLDVMARATGDETPIKSRPADRLEPELDEAKKELPASAQSIEDQLSFVLFPAIASDFFEAREKGDLTPDPLDVGSAKGPSTAHELHLAPVEFNVTVHGETYHVKVSGSGRKVDGRKPYYIRVNDKLEEVSLEPIQEVLAGVPESQEIGTGGKPKRPKPTKPGDVAPPMPGRVVKVLVAVNDSVKVGDPLLIIEAMKMESRVPAPIDGKVSAILVNDGDNVKTDETVIQLE
ncbi:2-oxoglutarate carboxylase large subunit [Candidatus Nitrospira nitrosa]|uniref:2-oxoglutarate carboxylase large subunit n=1 Tax=Candidatus Nitrospira nitrosa TaxID=1742972 RepID=A0A0S4LNL5_9BACT|nr:sodium-extruding oxaloacetate decarboxylase subunit alpha [Candidatus Nitrospira nitrosa]CUS37510.1 2-oxoglutarate carboxylase large subunit [Candidatus Nitrospira nitrosa]